VSDVAATTIDEVRRRAGGRPLVALATESALDADVHAAVMGAVLALLAARGELALAIPADSPQLDRARAHLGANPLGLELIAFEGPPLEAARNADLVLALPNPRVEGAARRVAAAATDLKSMGVNVIGSRHADATDPGAIAGANATGVMPLLSELLRSRAGVTDPA